MHSREVIFDPPDAAQQRESNQEPALLRALKELLEPDAKWYAFHSFNLYDPKPTQRLGVQKPRVLYSYWKPESARTHPEATVRPWATVQVVGDALSFSSALGYM